MDQFPPAAARPGTAIAVSVGWVCPPTPRYRARHARPPRPVLALGVVFRVLAIAGT